jgi:O-antigen ligase
MLKNNLIVPTHFVNNAVMLFIISILTLEINFGPLGFNLGNILAVLGSVFIIFIMNKSTTDNYFISILRMPDFLWALLLSCFYLISVYWSVSPKDTFVQSMYFIILLIGCYSLHGIDRSIIIRIILNCAFWVAILSLLALIIDRNYALQPFQSTSFPELRGIFKHQQRLGLFMCLSLGLAVIAYINKEKDVFIGRILKYKKSYIIFIGLVALFAFARLFILFSFIAFFVAFLLTKYRATKYITILLFLSYCFYLYNIDISSQLFESYKNGDLSLTGRLLVWERSINHALLSPLSGYGYGTFYSPTLDYIWAGDYRPPHAHNSFIQAFFDGGWIGLVLLMAVNLL